MNRALLFLMITSLTSNIHTSQQWTQANLISKSGALLMRSVDYQKESQKQFHEANAILPQKWGCAIICLPCAVCLRNELVAIAQEKEHTSLLLTQQSIACIALANTLPPNAIMRMEIIR